MDPVGTYHSLVADLTHIAVTYLGVPALYAPVLSLAVGLFGPVFLLTALFFAHNNYSGKAVWESASAGASFVHGGVTCIMAPLLVWRHLQHVSGPLSHSLAGVGAAANTAADEQLLQFSCAYFLVDLVLFVGLFARTEVLFAAHHLAVLFYMLVTLRLGYAGATALAAIAIGELTSPLQNTWYLLKPLRYDLRWADAAFKYVSWLFSAWYILCRSVVGPIVVAADVYAVWCTERLGQWRFCFIFLLVGALLGTQSWSIALSKRLRTTYKPAYGTRGQAAAKKDQ